MSSSVDVDAILEDLPRRPLDVDELEACLEALLDDEAEVVGFAYLVGDERLVAAYNPLRDGWDAKRGEP